jgi:hypothetical protein
MAALGKIKLYGDGSFLGSINSSTLVVQVIN